MSGITNPVVFFHVAHLGEWEAIDAEISGHLERSGLLEVATLYRCDRDDVENFEFPTLELLRNYAAGAEGPLLYLHTKGASRGGPTIADWRACMLYWLVERWRECVLKLEKGYDAVGINVIDSPVRHFQGNFWWTTAAHVRKLPPVREVVFEPTYDDQTERHKAEFWVLGKPARVYQPYHHRRNPYILENPRASYEGLPF